MDEVEIFFCQFPIPWALRVSGMGGFTSKCEKSQNHCTLLYMYYFVQFVQPGLLSPAYCQPSPTSHIPSLLSSATVSVLPYSVSCLSFLLSAVPSPSLPFAHITFPFYYLPPASSRNPFLLFYGTSTILISCLHSLFFRLSSSSFSLVHSSHFYIPFSSLLSSN